MLRGLEVDETEGKLAGGVLSGFLKVAQRGQLKIGSNDLNDGIGQARTSKIYTVTVN